MAQKNATPTKAQQAIMRRYGLDPAEWTVDKELRGSLVVLHRTTKEFRLLKKQFGKSILS